MTSPNLRASSLSRLFKKCRSNLVTTSTTNLTNLWRLRSISFAARLGKTYHSCPLIRRRVLDAVNDENVDGPSCRFQFEPELILQSLKERWSCILMLGAGRLGPIWRQ